MEQLNLTLRKVVAGVTVILLVFLVSAIYFKAYSLDGDFLGLIDFGSKFFQRAIPEVKSLPEFANTSRFPSKTGHDGQWYAQLSIDPTLSNPAFDRALDNPTFRARRIFIPALCYLAGFGNPVLILHIYSVINFIFWLLLICLLFRILPAYSYRSLLCIVAVALNSGVIFSMKYALTDLPTATLIIIAVLLQSYAGACVLLLAALSRENSLLGLFSLVSLKNRPVLTKKNIILFLIVLVPFIAWFLYSYLRFPHPPGYAIEGKNNFNLPFLSIIKTIYISIDHLLIKWPQLSASQDIFKVLGNTDIRNLLSILGRLIAISYIFICRKPDSSIWRFAFAFACLSLILSWQFGDRIFLPLIISFYILLASEKIRIFLPLFIMANLDLPYTIYNLIESYK